MGPPQDPGRRPQAAAMILPPRHPTDPNVRCDVCKRKGSSCVC